MASGAAVAVAQQGWVATRIAPPKQELNTVFFLDSKRGWAGGDDGFLVRTEDGGVTWTSQRVETTDAINDIYFRDKERGYLIAGNAIFKTEAGIRWTEARRFAPPEFEGATVELYCIRFSPRKRLGSGFISKKIASSIASWLTRTMPAKTWQRKQTPSNPN